VGRSEPGKGFLLYFLFFSGYLCITFSFLLSSKDITKNPMIESALGIISIFSVSSKLLSSIVHTNLLLICGQTLTLSHRKERLMVILYRLMCDTSAWLILITGIRWLVFLTGLTGRSSI
jgi:hypothetical protein